MNIKKKTAPFTNTAQSRQPPVLHERFGFFAQSSLNLNPSLSSALVTVKLLETTT
ncbi:MAG: hypothetical protein QXN82_00240 [Desulfurococcaceae archaeon]